MRTDTTADGTGEATTTVHSASGPLWVRPTGRHRKPRPRRVVLAVGGFALAAGALSLVRVAPESVTGGGGTAEAEPRIDASDTAATVGEAPSEAAVGPSAASVVRGASTVPVPTGTASPSAPPSAPQPRATDPATGIPEAPSTPTSTSAASRTPRPPETTPAASASTPAPTTPATTHAPAPSSNPPGLCVPLVGLCVRGLSAPGG
jgi:hypothetical protein